MNNNGQAIMINMLFLFMTLAVFVAMIPALSSILNMAQQSDALNCRGYIDPYATATSNLSYNASLPTNTLACLSIDLYLPYIVLAVLIGAVSKLLYGRIGGSEPQPAYSY